MRQRAEPAAITLPTAYFVARHAFWLSSIRGDMIYAEIDNPPTQWDAGVNRCGDAWMADDKNDLNELMMALGSVVVMWGMVEDVTRNFMRDLVLGNDTDETVERIILSETPFRTQLDILKKVAHVRRPNTDWFDRLAVQIGELSNSMHAERNRLIHDLWEQNEEGQILKYVRGKEETAVAKKRGEWQLKVTGEREVPVAEVEAFFEKAADCFDAMLTLKGEYVEWKTAEMEKEIFAGMAARMARKPMPRAAGEGAL